MKNILKYLFSSILLTTTTAQIPTNGLVAYYPLNGNATDASSSGLNGTNYNAVATTDRFGNANAAFLFWYMVKVWWLKVRQSIFRL